MGTFTEILTVFSASLILGSDDVSSSSLKEFLVPHGIACSLLLPDGGFLVFLETGKQGINCVVDFRHWNFVKRTAR